MLNGSMTDPGNIVIFLLYFVTSVILLAVFLVAYTLATRIHEWRLVGSGNSAAAVALGGAMIGFALPLASAMIHGQSLIDGVITAAIALVVQLLCFAAMRLLRRDARAALIAGDLAEGIFLASTSITLGILSAACLS
jgi:putative membrane protein